LMMLQRLFLPDRKNAAASRLSSAWMSFSWHCNVLGEGGRLWYREIVFLKSPDMHVNGFVHVRFRVFSRDAGSYTPGQIW